MKNFKRMTSLFFAVLMFSTTAFANVGNVASIMRDYQIQVRVNNVDPELAVKELSKKLLDEKISREDLIAYIESTTTAEEFESFLAMMESGVEEMANRKFIDGAEFQAILLQVFKSSQQNMGANYNGGQGGSCYSRGFGYVFVAVGVVLAVNLLQRRLGDTWLGDLLGNIDIDFGDQLGDTELTIATAISGALGMYLMRRC